MKKQVHPTIRAHLGRSAFYVLLLLAVCVIPFALAQRNMTERSVTEQTHAATGPLAAASGAITGMPAVSANSDAVMPVTDQSLLPHAVSPNLAASRLPRVSSGPGVRPILIKSIPKFPEVILYDQLDNPGGSVSAHRDNWASTHADTDAEISSDTTDSSYTGVTPDSVEVSGTP
jgi:hypothetical protein